MFLCLAFVFCLGFSAINAACRNIEKDCPAWTKYCANNDWVQSNCQKSCKLCPKENPRQNGFRRFPAIKCEDRDKNCLDWVQNEPELCANTAWIQTNCKKSCGSCGSLPKKYDLRHLPPDLKSIGFLVGRWRSEHDGKAIFPTIPVFTYGEELDFSIAEPPMFGARALNYSAFAWGINEKLELHSEYGFLAARNQTKYLALTTVMNNGFTTIEEGYVEGKRIRLRLQDIGRISFSRDLPVHDMVREFVLLDARTLEQRLSMETLTHPMQGHTQIRYKKIYP